MVTNTADSGPGSLRQAVLDANVFESVGDVINFSPGVFGAGATITLNTSVPITNAVTIEGLGRSKVVVAGAGTDRLFVVDGSGVFDVTFKSLTLTGGNAAATSGVGRRGGVAVVQDERVTIDDCLVSNNISAMEGGVIGANGPANITLVNSTFTGNSAAQDGGVLYFYDGGDFTINGCTLSGNTSSAPLYGGGAVYFFGSAADGTLDIVNSTISGNFSNISGGGVAVRTFGGNLRVRNSTIVANSAGGLSPGQGGGGIAVIGGTGSVSLESSIVSGNTAPLAPEIVSTPQVTATNSAIGDSIGFTLSPGSGSNLPFATDLKLDPTLAANGGTNFSHLPLSGSPLRNAGANPAGLSFDQRGPGFPRVLGSKADIGAIESVDPIPTAVAQATNLIASGGTQHTITVTFEDDVAINVGTIKAGNISITTPALGTLTPGSVTVDLGSNGTPRVATFTFAAPGGTWDGADTGTYVVNILANQVADTGGNFVPAGQIGSFDVLLPRVIEVTDAGDSGPGTLRDALARANQFITPEGPDTITFSKSLFVAAQPLLLGSAVPITDHVVVIGPGVENVTIDATGQGRHFTISGAGTLKVSLSGMTLINGLVNGLDGGAIFTDDEDVTLDQMFISGNQATGAAGDGGAIGVGAFGKLTLLRSTVTGNAAPGGAGGGIYFLNNGELTIVDSTLSGNSSLDGGAVYFFGTANNDIIIRNSTLYANQAGRGAGVTLNAFAGKLTVQNSTIAKNTATTTDGGGIFRSDTSTGTIALQSSIVAENGDESTTLAPDIYSLGAVTSTRSALTSTAGMSAFSDLGGTLIGQNLDLQPLAKNGGPTETLALGPASKAIDAGFNATPTSNDQRGISFVRTFDQAGSPNAADGTDIGAFELQPAAPVTPAKVLGVVINNGDAQRSRVTTLRVNFNQPVAITDVSKAITLNRVSDSASVTLNPVLDGTGTFVTVNFTGGATEGAPGKFSLQDGRYTLTVLASQFAGAGLDGNGDNTAGDNFVLLSTPYGTPSPMSPATGVFRLAGDGNGDGIVDPSDFLLFRLSFLGSNDAFDFDGINGVDPNDFLRFRLNFLKQVV